MEIENISKALVPSTFMEEKAFTIVESDDPSITDCVEVHIRESNKGKKYKQYSLAVRGVHPEDLTNEVQDYLINYLFLRDLQSIIKKHGNDTQKWIGKELMINTVEDGEYLRWRLVPT